MCYECSTELYDPTCAMCVAQSFMTPHENTSMSKDNYGFDSYFFAFHVTTATFLWMTKCRLET